MLSDEYLQSTQSDDHRHHRKEKNRDAARKSRKKHTETADILHEVRSKLRPSTHSLSFPFEWVCFSLTIFMLPLQILTFVVYVSFHSHSSHKYIYNVCSLLLFSDT